MHPFARSPGNNVEYAARHPVFLEFSTRRYPHKGHGMSVFFFVAYQKLSTSWGPLDGSSAGSHPHILSTLFMLRYGPLSKWQLQDTKDPAIGLPILHDITTRQRWLWNPARQESIYHPDDDHLGPVERHLAGRDRWPPAPWMRNLNKGEP
ncbi:hypothetical protein BU24DRAFT_458408 [Aaosphaeria arxii CBS 175.79]|uniref:Uncharacterized protein n=1 Tax=Aaosphaeria arxii CBS 175.79 TaxID=1450172 RepID=A0A6A5Y259_9PLEO|nr:uncharacterized protein BU24DRAFT_458408 [Aaosphaeria arxii CBS 175.79]KAF2018654.1 hypothetical protein BU24DRAFT_458408 [Aaosphaeria arxii CBS 175.79]